MSIQMPGEDSDSVCQKPDHSQSPEHEAAATLVDDHHHDIAVRHWGKKKKLDIHRTKPQQQDNDDASMRDADSAIDIDSYR